MHDTVGIDLGTTISTLARVDAAGRVELARTRDGHTRMRSVVAVGAGGKTVVGEHAVRMAALDPDSCFSLFKRSMGTSWSVTEGDRTWTPEELSAEILLALTEDAEASFGAKPLRAVITIPAYFGDDARRATQRAGELAGLEVASLLHEPTAAIFSRSDPGPSALTALVYDLGGGTFDVSVVSFAPDRSEVLATLGDHRLGGKDWDDVMVELAVDALANPDDDPRDDSSLLFELQERAREAKHSLSRLDRVSFNVSTPSGVERVEVTRDSFLERAAPLFARTEDIVARVLDDIGGAARIDEVLLVGGSSRMPACGEIVRRVTGREPVGGVDPDEAVVRGAAIVAQGSGDLRGRTAIRRISDVTPHALGFVVVSAEGDRYVNQVMIARNASIPASATREHELEVPVNGSGTLEVHMLQGEAERPLDNQPLGCWRFEGVTKKRGGSVRVGVSYEYDADAIVQVSAAVRGETLGSPKIDRDQRDLRWTDEDPSRHGFASLAVALVIDTSYSMEGDKLAEAKMALTSFVDEFEEAGASDRLLLVNFSSEASCSAPTGSSAKTIKRAASDLRPNGGTDMAAGLEVASKEFPESAENRVMVVLTDGQPNDRAKTVKVREALVEQGVEIIARGVQGADADFLKQLATQDAELLDLAQLSSSFRGIARQLVAGGMAVGRRG